MMRKTLLPSLAAITLAALLGACDKAPQTPTASKTTRHSLPTMTASAGAPLEYTVAGSVISDQRVDVASRLSGHIREILVQEGDRVRRGQLLARLDAADVEGGIRQGQAADGVAAAALHDAQIDLERFQRLFERGSVSDNELRKVRLKFEAARQSHRQARAALDTARAQLAYAEITSSVDGVVVARHKRAGDLAVPGAPLLTLESNRGLLFETFVAESQVTAIAAGAPVQVSIDGLPTPLHGRVSRVVRAGDPVTRSYQVKVTLPETAGLMSGMFGRAAFPLGKSHLPTVPRAALAEIGGLTGVFVVDAQDVAHFRWLRIGREWPDHVEVNAGLTVGERFVAVADTALRDGGRITTKAAAR